MLFNILTGISHAEPVKKIPELNFPGSSNLCQLVCRNSPNLFLEFTQSPFPGLVVKLLVSLSGFTLMSVVFIQVGIDFILKIFRQLIIEDILEISCQVNFKGVIFRKFTEGSFRQRGCAVFYRASLPLSVPGDFPQ